MKKYCREFLAKIKAIVGGKNASDCIYWYDDAGEVHTISANEYPGPGLPRIYINHHSVYVRGQTLNPSRRRHCHLELTITSEELDVCVNWAATYHSTSARPPVELREGEIDRWPLNYAWSAAADRIHESRQSRSQL